MLRKFRIVICLFLACNVLFAGKIIVHRGRTVVRIRKGIPNHNYAAKNRSRSITAISKRGILMGKTVEETNRRLNRLSAIAPEIKTRATTLNAFGQPVLELTGRDNLPGLTQKLLTLQSKEQRVALIDEMKAQQEFVRTANSNYQAEARQLAENRIQEIATQLATSPDESESAGASATGDVTNAEPRIKLFQLAQPTLSIDHCSISQFALQVEESGNWTLSLKADQNRRRNAYKPTQYIKRNEFQIRIRALGAIRSGFTRLDDGAGRPVLAQWQPIKFFVENGAPYYARWSSDDTSEATDNDAKEFVSKELLARFFEDSDRIEVEFFYR